MHTGLVPCTVVATSEAWRRSAAGIVLIGYRGSGKTSVGRILAPRLGLPFVDTDERIAALTARSIVDLFATIGAAAFRRLETSVIAQLVGQAPAVVSVGGGAVLARANRRRLPRLGLCIWLTAPPEELYRRISADQSSRTTRPALAGGGLEEVRLLLARREPLYAALADHVVPTAGRSVAQVAETVVQLVKIGRPAADAH